MTESTARSQASAASTLQQWAPLVLNLLLLGLLIWHVAFEAVPSAIEHSSQLASVVDRGLSWLPLLPYLVLAARVIHAPHVLRRWRCASAIIVAVLVYAPLTMVRFSLVHRDFLPPV